MNLKTGAFASRPSYLEIDLDAYSKNIANFRKHLAGETKKTVKICTMVKANAYGHGLIEIAKRAEKSGVDYLGVAFLEEGVILRDAGIRIPILILGGIVKDQIESYLKYDLEITVSSNMKAQQINEVARNMGKKAIVHLKIDTGMQRIGVQYNNAIDFYTQTQELEHLKIRGIYSHLADADNEDNFEFVNVQLQRFKNVIDDLEQMFDLSKVIKHIANGAAAIKVKESWYDMIRVGIASFGFYPDKKCKDHIELHPVLGMKSQVVYFKVVPKNTSISYGRTYFTKEQTRIVTVPIGHGDGLDTRLDNIGKVIINGKIHKMAGRICMDQFMVDIGMDGEAYNGDQVVIIGKQGDQEITLEQICDECNINPFEFLSRLTSRLPRFYRSVE